MRRRTLLASSLAGAGLLTAAGWGLVAWPQLAAPAWDQDGFSPAARELMAAVAGAVLGNLLPDEPALHAAALDQHLGHLQTAIQGLPQPVQAELNLVLRLLLAAPGRQALCGLSTAWPQASAGQVATALQRMQHSRLMLRKQVYQALRDLHFAAWTANSSNWTHLGYTGPITL